MAEQDDDEMFTSLYSSFKKHSRAPSLFEALEKAGGQKEVPSRVSHFIKQEKIIGYFRDFQTVTSLQLTKAGGPAATRPSPAAPLGAVRSGRPRPGRARPGAAEAAHRAPVP